MLDVTAYLAHNTRVRVTGALADNTTAPYYCLLLCVNATREDTAARYAHALAAHRTT